MKSPPEQKDVPDTAVIKGRERTLNSLPTHEKWVRETGKIGAEIHIAVLAPYINEAGQWLYKGSE
jgi:hypothetical protein